MQDRMQLMSINPHSMYVYWQIGDQTKKLMEAYLHAEWSLLSKYLRVYDVKHIPFNGDNANRSWLILLPDEAEHWFVRDIIPDCSYCVDYGTVLHDGRFLAITRSNITRVPPDHDYGDSERVTYNHNQQAKEPEWKSSFTGYSLFP